MWYSLQSVFGLTLITIPRVRRDNRRFNVFLRIAFSIFFVTAVHGAEWNKCPSHAFVLNCDIHSIFCPDRGDYIWSMTGSTPAAGDGITHKEKNP
jgi:hypothetical protein